MTDSVVPCSPKTRMTRAKKPNTGRGVEDERLAVEGDAVSVGHVEGDVGVGDLVDEDVVGRCQGNQAGQQGDDTDDHHHRIR